MNFSYQAKILLKTTYAPLKIVILFSNENSTFENICVLLNSSQNVL